MRFVTTAHPRWRLRPAQKFGLRLRALRGHRGIVQIRDAAGQVLLDLIDDQLTITESYYFDGCTLAPDCPRALRGCCVHDALLQILRAHPGRFPRRWAHRALLEVQRRDRFPLARLYYAAVLAWPFQPAFKSHAKHR